MSELNDLKALPEIVQAWGSAWLFITAGAFWLVSRVLINDELLLKEAEIASASELWRANEYLRNKFRGSTLHSSVIGSDYLTTVEHLRELSNLANICVEPLTIYRSYRKYADAVRASLFAHALAWGGWVILILLTDANEGVTGIPLFFGPIALALMLVAKALSLRNSLHR